jgi:PhnO protein
MTDKIGIDACSIRRAQDDDADNVRNLYSQLSPDVSNVDRDFRSMLADPRAMCLILEMASKPVGMVVAYVRPTLSSGRKMVIDELVIDRDLRGQRLGSLLLEHCIGVAKDQGLDSVEVCCSLAKPELHRFYERTGFKHRMRLYSVFLK